MVKSLLLAALAVSGASAHGTLVRLQAQNGVATKAQGSNGVNMRTGVPRVGGDVPGEIPSYNCDHCIMENVPLQEGGAGGWWSSRPGSHWDNQDTWPQVTPCMSSDGYGTRGIIEIVPGEVVETSWYVNADHGGFYRFEMAAGREPTNADFMGGAISPFYSLHAEVETPGFTYPERVVGFTKNETDMYQSQMVAVGAGLGSGRLNANADGQSSGHCLNNYSDCYLDDRVTIPEGTPAGEYVIRWNWFSSETPQVYTACVDVVVN
jgi:hypothetical protein